MKKLFFIIGLFFSLSAMAQPTNYTKINMRYRWLSGMFDSALYVPRYNGTPSGVRVNETSAIDGMIAMDTTNNRLYIYSGGSWIRLAAYSEIAAYTAGNGLTLSGSQFKLGGTLTENTTIEGSATESLNFNDIKKFRVTADDTLELNINPGGTGYLLGDNDIALKWDADQIYLPNISSGASTDSVLVWTAGTGQVKKRNVSSLVSTPTLQQVLTAGSTLTINNVINTGINTIKIIGGDSDEDYLIINPTINSESSELRSSNTSTTSDSRVKVSTSNVAISSQLESDWGDGLVVSRFENNVTSSTSNSTIISYEEYGKLSSVIVDKDSVSINPSQGIINIDSLRTWSGVSDTTHKKPMTWDTRNGRWEYAANWYGGGGGITTGQLTDSLNTVWRQTGSIATNTVNYFGTKNNRSVDFIVNNSRIAQMDSTGLFKIGNTSDVNQGRFRLQGDGVLGYVGNIILGNGYISPQANTNMHMLADGTGIIRIGAHATNGWVGLMGKVSVNQAGWPGHVPTSGFDVRASTVFNEDGADYDFRVEGDTDPNLIFADASADEVRIGTSTDAGAYKLQVNGKQYISSALSIGTTSNDSTLHVVGGFKLVNGTQGAGKVLTSDANGGASWQVNKVNLVFGAGSGADADTSAFTTSAIYGSFFTEDTIVVTSFRAVLQGTGADVTYKIWYNDSLNVEAGATALNTAGNQVTSLTTGDNVTSITNTKIPPNVWVWVKTSTVATKPKYFSLTLNGYRK